MLLFHVACCHTLFSLTFQLVVMLLTCYFLPSAVFHLVHFGWQNEMSFMRIHEDYISSVLGKRCFNVKMFSCRRRLIRTHQKIEFKVNERLHRMSFDQVKTIYKKGCTSDIMARNALDKRIKYSVD